MAMVVAAKLGSVVFLQPLIERSFVNKAGQLGPGFAQDFGKTQTGLI